MKNKKIKKFGFYFAIGMALLTAVGLWKGFPVWLVTASAVLCFYHLVSALAAPVLSVPAFYATEFLGKVIGNILTVIIFSIVYYFLFTPVSFLLRMAGKDVISANSLNPKWTDIPDSDNNPERVEKLF